MNPLHQAVELASDGRKVWFQGDDHRRVPSDLQATVRQCSHQLATMLGSNWRSSCKNSNQ
jgi:hypothetical protein